MLTGQGLSPSVRETSSIDCNDPGKHGNSGATRPLHTLQLVIKSPRPRAPCHLVRLPGPAAAAVSAVEETEGGCAGQSATTHPDFLPNGVAIPPADTLPENVQESEV